MSDYTYSFDSLSGAEGACSLANLKDKRDFGP